MSYMDFNKTTMPYDNADDTDIIEDPIEINHQFPIGQKLNIMKLDAEDEASYPSYVKDLGEEDTLFIDTPSTGSYKPTIKPSELIEIYIITKDCVWAGECEVLKVESGHISGLWVTYPETLKKIQRREFLRWEFDFPVQVHTDGTATKAECANLSGGGIAVISKQPLQIDPETKVKFKRDDIDADLEVSYVHIQYDHIFKHYITGLRFKKIDQQLINKIQKAIFRDQIEMRRKGLI